MGIKIPADYKLPPGTIQQTQAFLQHQTDSFGLYFSYDRLQYHRGHLEIKAKGATEILRLLGGFSGVGKLTRNEILDALMNRFDVPSYKLLGKNNTLSVAQPVIDALFEDPEITPELKQFLEIYKILAECNGALNNLTQFLTHPMTNERDEDGERLICLHPTWNILSTKRFSSSNPNMQNLSRKLNDIFTAPKGYKLVHTDSGQIEPRITYSAYIPDPLIIRLITLYDDAYFGLLHYILLSEAEEKWSRDNLMAIKKREITAEEKNKRQRLKVLGLAGNYGSSNLALVDAELGPLYENKVVNHPLRREWERRVTDEVRAGADHFYAYFGTPVYPGDSKSAETKQGSSGWKSHVIRCGVNNPIQTTASELMHISIRKVQSIIQPGEHVAGYIHDAGLFYVPEDKVEERAPIFQQCLAYDVDGWIPIGSDLTIGREKSGYAEPLF